MNQTTVTSMRITPATECIELPAEQNARAAFAAQHCGDHQLAAILRRVKIYVTPLVHAECIKLHDKARERGQDETSRMEDLAWMLGHAGRYARMRRSAQMFPAQFTVVTCTGKTQHRAKTRTGAYRKHGGIVHMDLIAEFGVDHVAGGEPCIVIRYRHHEEPIFETV
jgi:hypothetical protein